MMSNCSILMILGAAMLVPACGNGTSDAVATLTKLKAQMCGCGPEDRGCARAVAPRVDTWRAEHAKQPQPSTEERAELEALQRQIDTCMRRATWELPSVPSGVELPDECRAFARSLEKLYSCAKMSEADMQPWVDIYSGVLAQLAKENALSADAAHIALEIDQAEAHACDDSTKSIATIGKLRCGW